MIDTIQGDWGQQCEGHPTFTAWTLMHLRQGHECTEAGRRGGPASGGGGRSFKTGVLTALSAFSSLAARFMLDLEGAESGGWSCIDWSCCTESLIATSSSHSELRTSLYRYMVTLDFGGRDHRVRLVRLHCRGGAGRQRVAERHRWGTLGQRSKIRKFFGAQI